MAQRRKLSTEEVHHLRELHAVRKRMLAAANNYTMTRLAKRFHLSYAAVNDIVNGRSYKNV